MWHGKADLLVEKFWEYRLVVLVPGVSLDMPGIRGSFFLMCFFCVEDDDRESFLGFLVACLSGAERLGLFLGVTPPCL